MKLWQNALLKYICGLLLVGLLLFLPAGSLRYGGAWRMIALLFIPMLILGMVLLKKAPDLLAKRLCAKEQQQTQKKVISLSALGFIAGFIAAGLDFRFGLTRVPQWLVIFASLLQLAAYGLYAEVMRENAYLSRTIEVQENQQVIDTGLYGVVRHPMYAATVLLFMAMPLVLGSWMALIVFLHYPVLMILRIRNEEAVLAAGLPGYRDYMQRVKYRLIPFVW